MVKQKIYSLLNSKYIHIFIQILIIVSIITFSIETLPKLDKNTYIILNYIEYFTIAVFTIEYVVRIISSNQKIKFIFSFYGIIDFLAIAPFYISTGLDLRSLRIFRLFRLFRIFKLLRYSKAIQRFKESLSHIKEELVIFTILTLILLYLSSIGIYYFEHEAQPEQFSSIFHSLWWSVATLTTVGYGDVYPITVGGKIFTFMILMIGLGIVAIPTGLIASSLAFGKEQ